MRFGFHLLAWREQNGLSQVQLAERSGVLRPYLSRIERNDVDPSLSLVVRLAAALDLSPGKLIDEMPPALSLDRHKMDAMARDFLRRDRKTRIGEHALRKLRVQLGEDQFQAFMRRVQKHAPYET